MPKTINPPEELQFAKNIGVIVGKLRKLTAPVNRDVIWAYPLNGSMSSDICELRVFNGATGQWEPLRGNTSGGGTVNASDVKVNLVDLTETIGGRGPGNFEGTLEEFLYETWKRFKAPAFSYFTFMGSASVLRPVGYSYPGGSQAFTWDTQFPLNVQRSTIFISDMTKGQDVATSLSTNGNVQATVDGFVVTRGTSRTYRIKGIDVESNPFEANINISGEYYRFAFVADQDLLSTTAFSTDASLSAFIRLQPGAELVYSRVMNRTFVPQAQFIYLVFDESLMTSGVGVTIVSNGLVNNASQTRSFVFTNEYGATNNMRIIRSANLLNTTYAYQTS